MGNDAKQDLLNALKANAARIKRDIEDSEAEVEFAKSRLANDLRRLSDIEDKIADLEESA